MQVSGQKALKAGVTHEILVSWKVSNPKFQQLEPLSIVGYHSYFIVISTIKV